MDLLIGNGHAIQVLETRSGVQRCRHAGESRGYVYRLPNYTATEALPALPRSLIGGAYEQEGNQNVLEQFQLQTDDPQSLRSLGQTDGWPIEAFVLQ